MRALYPDKPISINGDMAACNCFGTSPINSDEQLDFQPGTAPFFHLRSETCLQANNAPWDTLSLLTSKQVRESCRGI